MPAARSELETMQRIARRALPARWFAFVGIIGFGLVFCSAALGFGPFAHDRYLIPALLGAMWSLAALTFIITFHDLPPPVGPATRGFARVLARVRRAFYWILAGALGALTVMTAYLTLSLLRLWAADSTA